jgi:hypothetical protein
MTTGEPPHLATYTRCIERIRAGWPAFRASHLDRLRHGDEPERTAEAIIEDLFTAVLDWSKGDLMYQVDYADIVVSHNLAKYLVIEVKRPGTLFPGRRALDDAIRQARRYADEQNIPSVAATDGRYLYAADIRGGGLVDRASLDLTAPEAPIGLWALSVHGIYRTCEALGIDVPIASDPVDTTPCGTDPTLLHHKYQLPAECFAYVPDSNDPRSWKLPYRLADGGIDQRRLPKAIQSILSNYRGTRVEGIPEAAMREVLIRLARAATMAGHLPANSTSAPTYRQLAQTLEQLRIAL